jgi:CDP-diacylglycerol--glycerol-3-phosphate 3-phosphatidyltransferase
MNKEWAKPANYITLLRMLATIVLYFIALSGEVSLFIVVFLLAGATDAVDGIVARRRGEATDWGAKFDSVADYFFYGSAFVWMHLLHPEIFREMVALGILLALVLINLTFKLWAKHGYLHLLPSKVVAVAIFAFVLLTLLVGFYPIALYIVVGLYFIAVVAELAHIRRHR